MTTKTTERGYKIYQYIIIGAIAGAFWLTGSPFASASVILEQIDTTSRVLPTVEHNSGGVQIIGTCIDTSSITTSTIVSSVSAIYDIGQLGTTGYANMNLYEYSDNNCQTSMSVGNVSATFSNESLSEGLNLLTGDLLSQNFDIDTTGSVALVLYTQYATTFLASFGSTPSVSVVSPPQLADTGVIFYSSLAYSIDDSPTPENLIIPVRSSFWIPVETGYEDCGGFDFFCHIRNAFRWAFTPPAGTFDNWTTLLNTLKTKAPFGYVTSVFDNLTGIDNTGTATVTMESVTPINNLIFNPIRTGLEWLLYFAFAFMLFKRFKDINI